MRHADRARRLRGAHGLLLPGLPDRRPRAQGPPALAPARAEGCGLIAGVDVAPTTGRPPASARGSVDRRDVVRRLPRAAERSARAAPRPPRRDPSRIVAERRPRRQPRPATGWSGHVRRLARAPGARTPPWPARRLDEIGERRARPPRHRRCTVAPATRSAVVGRARQRRGESTSPPHRLVAAALDPRRQRRAGRSARRARSTRASIMPR